MVTWSLRFAGPVCALYGDIFCTFLAVSKINGFKTSKLIFLKYLHLTGARAHGLSYSQFIGKLKTHNIELNRKVLADLAMNSPEAFKAIVDKVK